MKQKNFYSCETCGSTKNITLQPSTSQLIFGGFPVRMAYRCGKCEKELVKKVNRAIKEIGKYTLKKG